jgi:hypothetical protein
LGARSAKQVEHGSPLLVWTAYVACPSPMFKGFNDLTRMDLG